MEYGPFGLCGLCGGGKTAAYIYIVSIPLLVIRSSYWHDHLHYYGMAVHHAYCVSQKCHFYCWNQPYTSIEKKTWEPEIRI